MQKRDMRSKPSRRFMRRLKVRFRKYGDSKESHGYTTNISETGMFVATPRPVRPGIRLDVEVTDKKQTLRLDVVVVHARRSPANWQHILPSGVGVRFLDTLEDPDTLRRLMGRARVQ